MSLWKCAMAKNYILIFSDTIKSGKFPVAMSADTGKDNKPKITNMGALWPTLGTIIPTSSLRLKNRPTQFWVPNDYVVVKVAYTEVVTNPKASYLHG